MYLCVYARFVCIIAQNREVGPCEPHEVHQGQVQGPPPGSGQPPVSMWAEGQRN